MLVVKLLSLINLRQVRDFWLVYLDTLNHANRWYPLVADSDIDRLPIYAEATNTTLCF